MSTVQATTLSNGTVSRLIEMIANGAALWLIYDQATGPSIRDSYNVTSVTDVATGDFDVNLTAAMDSAAYPLAQVGQPNRNGGIDSGADRPTSSAFTCQTHAGSGASAIDNDENHVVAQGFRA